MAPPLEPGVPRPSPKPQPIGNIPLILLFTTCGLLAIVILLRKADALRSVVAHQLQTWSQGAGGIRLSEDDGPSATEFIQDDIDDDISEFEEGNELLERPLDLGLEAEGLSHEEQETNLPQDRGLRGTS